MLKIPYKVTPSKKMDQCSCKIIKSTKTFPLNGDNRTARKICLKHVQKCND